MQDPAMAVSAGRTRISNAVLGEMLRTLTAWGMISLSACATLPDVHRVEIPAKTDPVKFETAHGPVSKSTSTAILKDLNSES